MIKQTRRDFVWAGLMRFASGFFGLCTYGYINGFLSSS
jgi:hypothetical protein